MSNNHSHNNNDRQTLLQNQNSTNLDNLGQSNGTNISQMSGNGQRNSTLTQIVNSVDLNNLLQNQLRGEMNGILNMSNANGLNVFDEFKHTINPLTFKSMLFEWMM